jgi:hypothetical protein
LVRKKGQAFWLLKDTTLTHDAFLCLTPFWTATLPYKKNGDLPKEVAVCIGLLAKEIARVKPPLPRRSPEKP